MRGEWWSEHWTGDRRTETSHADVLIHRDIRTQISKTLSMFTHFTQTTIRMMWCMLWVTFTIKWLFGAIKSQYVAQPHDSSQLAAVCKKCHFDVSYWKQSHIIHVRNIWSLINAFKLLFWGAITMAPMPCEKHIDFCTKTDFNIGKNVYVIPSNQHYTICICAVITKINFWWDFHFQDVCHFFYC